MFLFAYFNNWVLYADIKEIWMLCGHGITTQAVPIHDLFSVMNPEVVSILPAVHALGGCDTTSKIGTKKASLKAAEKYGFQMLFRFGEDDLTPEMITSAEDFLVKCVSKNNEITTFDDLRYKTFHKNVFQLDIEKLPCTSSSIVLHIKRAYLQCYRWVHAAYLEDIALNPIDYGYSLNENNVLAPEIVLPEITPDNFPIPCKCLKCSKATVCPCRLKSITCCAFCKCEATL